MIDELTQAWLDEAIARAVERFGVYVHYEWPSSGDEALAYTVGLMDGDRPELVLVGRPLPRAADILNHLAGQVRAGRALDVGSLVVLPDGARLRAAQLAAPELLLQQAARRSRRGLRAILLLPADKRQGLSPDPPSCPRSGVGRNDEMPFCCGRIDLV